jgi:Domain of unknown function (DUF5666)
MLWKRVTAAVAGLGLLGALADGVLATAHPAAAAPAAQAQAQATVVRAAGKITAVQTSGFTLQNPKHTYTVAVGANTWIVVKKNGKAAEGALSDLQVGETVRVAGTGDSTDHVTARVVTEGGVRGKPAGPRPSNNKAGKLARAALTKATVQASANGVLTLAGKNNQTRTVNTDAGTVVIKGGLGAVSDLKAGDVVTVVPRALRPAAGTPRPAAKPALTAAVIYVPAPGDRLVPGVVASVSGNTVTLRGKHTITLAANTTVQTLGAAGQAPAAASASDLKAGSQVLLYGPRPAQGQPATATLVLIRPAVTK